MATESIAEQAVRVLYLVSKIDDGITIEDPHRHVVRELKRNAQDLLVSALRQAEGLAYAAESLRELGRASREAKS